MLTDGAGTSVPAASTVNIFSGRPIAFLGQPTNVTLLLVADAALQTAQVLVNVGANQMAPIAAGTPINTAPAAGQGPKNDEDVMATFAVPAGGLSACNVTNPTGGAVINRYRALLS